MVKLLKIFMLSIIISTFGNVAYAINYGNTKETAIELECNTCSSDLDFTNAAKQINPQNSTTYYLVYNEYSGVFKTVFAIWVYEPEVPHLGIRTASIVSSTTDALDGWDEYKSFLSGGASKSTLELEMPVSNGESYAAYMSSRTDSLLQQWVLGTKNLKPFSWNKYNAVKVTFSNGDEAIFAVTGFASIANVPILYVVNKDGVLINVLGTNGATASTADGGQSTLFTMTNVPGYYVICVGKCQQVPEGTIIIKQD